MKNQSTYIPTCKQQHTNIMDEWMIVVKDFFRILLMHQQNNPSVFCRPGKNYRWKMMEAKHCWFVTVVDVSLVGGFIFFFTPTWGNDPI